MIGQELRSRRESLGLTQAELADRLEVATNTVARWERNELRIARPQMIIWALRAIEDELAHLTDEQIHTRNLRHQQETERRLAEIEAAGPSPERDAAERWFGKH